MHYHIGIDQYKNNENCEYVVPESGTYANFNTIEVNKNSDNKDLAYKYKNSSDYAIKNISFSAEKETVLHPKEKEGPGLCRAYGRKRRPAAFV